MRVSSALARGRKLFVAARETWSPGTLLVATVALAALLRAGIVIASEGAWFATDSAHYFRLAGDIVAGDPTSERSNGYPLLIALLSHALPGRLLPLGLLSLNVVASVTAVALVGRIGKNVSGWGVGLLAALVVALYPNQLNYVRYLLTEAPAALVLTAAVWLLVRRRRSWGEAVLAGVLVGFGVLLRSSLLAVGGLLLVVLLVARRPWRECAGFATGMVLVAVLNAALIATGTIAPTRHAGPNVLMAIQSSSSEGIVFSAEAFSAEERARPFVTYLRFAAEHPLTFAEQRLSALWELWGPWPSAGDPQNPRSVLARLLIGVRFLLIALAAGGLVRHARDSRAWVIVAPVLAITAVHVAFFATPRFTHVVEPLTAVLAAWFVMDLARHRHRRHVQAGTMAP
jgi:hypothetical protein